MVLPRRLLVPRCWCVWGPVAEGVDMVFIRRFLAASRLRCRSSTTPFGSWVLIGSLPSVVFFPEYRGSEVLIWLFSRRSVAPRAR